MVSVASAFPEVKPKASKGVSSNDTAPVRKNWVREEFRMS